MDIAGTGISAFTAKVLPDFRVQTNLSIKWRKLTNGDWSGLDRGAASDIYEADIGLYGKEAVIDKFIDEIEANRVVDNHTINLSNFFDTERIFGENVDHTSIVATVLEISRRRQGSFKGWGLDATIRATPQPTFTGSSSFPVLNSCDFGVDADSDRTIRKLDSYTNVFSYQDHAADSGTFTGIFTVNNADFILLRNFIRTQRTGNFTLSDTFGITSPFGTRTANSYPFTTKLIEWEDMGFFGLLHHKISLTFAEVV